MGSRWPLGADSCRVGPSSPLLHHSSQENDQNSGPRASPTTRMQVIRVRPRGYVGVAFSLISRVGVDSVVPGDPAPFALVRMVGQKPAESSSSAKAWPHGYGRVLDRKLVILLPWR
jgi:hypothetical protein